MTLLPSNPYLYQKKKKKLIFIFTFDGFLLDASMGLVDIMKKKILSNLNVDPIVGLICPIPSGETKFYWLAP